MSIGSDTITAIACSPAAVDTTVVLCADEAVNIDLSSFETYMTDNGDSEGGDGIWSGYFNQTAPVYKIETDWAEIILNGRPPPNPPPRALSPLI